MNIALFGLGQMGEAVVHLLNKLEQDIHITAYDSKDNCPSNIKVDEYITCDIKEVSTKTFNGNIPDLILSALPFYCNYRLALVAIQNGINYADLGGSVDIAKLINEAGDYSEKSYVFTDLGLAPGWANILAEEACALFAAADQVPSDIEMFCGGLPQKPMTVDPFRYNLTWSEEGLYNEYNEEAEILIDGDIVKQDSLTGQEKVQIDNITGGSLEAFYTSGGAGKTLKLMQNRGVKNCEYKTLRYPGHCRLIYYFMKIKKYSIEQVKNLFIDYDNIDDVVFLNVYANSVDYGLTYNKLYTIYPEFGFTAMQLSTAGGMIAAVLSIDPTRLGSLNYGDVDLDKFNKVIEKLGIINEQ